MYITLKTSTSIIVSPRSVGVVNTVDEVTIPEGCTGVFSIRLTRAKQGLLTSGIFFHSGWTGIPTIVVTNHNDYPVELLAGEEIGEIALLANSSPNPH